MEKAFVIGPGRWGTFIAKYLCDVGLDVTLYGRDGSSAMKQLISERKNELMPLPESLKLTTELSDMRDAEIVVISIGAQNLSDLMEEVKTFAPKDKTFVLCMKGIEIKTGKRLSEIAEEHLDPSNKVAVWLGPGHVEEFCAGRPNCMVIDSSDNETKLRLVELFSSNLIRFYYGNDLIGNEIGAAAKNVVGIAAGVLDGLGLSSLKGALMSRGTREISRLIESLGGNPVSVYGLCHLGDYEATVFSPYSHNRRFGEAFVKGEKFDKLAEGYYTVLALLKIGGKYNVDLPICRAVYDVVYGKCNAKEAIGALFDRSLKYEFA
ncbi:MAG: NAD(P)H-dependent glycerol-3-phosphate dehydrogenase [Clostridia bacterium]|nr:NAD(P)H-dependent glycerol-3-phosphate dehydrogenase [Clostridia bacterium]